MSYDIAVIGLATPGRLSVVETSLSPAGGKQAVVSGLAKLSQAVMFLFATEPGSIAYNTTLGASPVNALLRRNNLDKETIDNQIANTAQQITEQLRSITPASAPDSERLRNLDITATALDDETGRVSLVIALSSLAGDAADYSISVTIPQ